MTVESLSWVGLVVRWLMLFLPFFLWFLIHVGGCNGVLSRSQGASEGGDERIVERVLLTPPHWSIEPQALDSAVLARRSTQK